MSNAAATATRTWDTAAELCHVTKYFDQKRPVSLFKREVQRIHALDDVSFTLQKGEFAAYAGPNGAGKSTTFKLLSGMLRPQAGEVRLFGMDPARSRIEVMRRTGVLFGNRSELWWDHPVRASFDWKKEVWDIPDDVYQRAVGELRELLDLDGICQPTNAAGEYTWKSSDTKYATVNADGVVKAVKAGKTVSISCLAADGSGKSAVVKIKLVNAG